MNDQSKKRELTASEMIRRGARASRRMTTEERLALIIASEQSSQAENIPPCAAKEPQDPSQGPTAVPPSAVVDLSGRKRKRELTASEMIRRGARALQRMTMDERWAALKASEVAAEEVRARFGGPKQCEEAP